MGGAVAGVVSASAVRGGLVNIGDLLVVLSILLGLASGGNSMAATFDMTDGRNLDSVA